jgi:hypothetical protein
LKDSSFPFAQWDEPGEESGIVAVVEVEDIGGPILDCNREDDRAKIQYRASGEFVTKILCNASVCSEEILNTASLIKL